MVCRMDHNKKPTEDQIANPDFGCAQLNMSLKGYLDMTAFFTCFKCRPEMRPMKAKRKKKTDADTEYSVSIDGKNMQMTPSLKKIVESKFAEWDNNNG